MEFVFDQSAMFTFEWEVAWKMIKPHEEEE